MMWQQSDLTSVNAVIDNLPGVLVNEGDVFGSDDWSTTLSIRGFQNSLNLQQIGITIDGIPNGNSNYGGGSKANRFIDPMNSAGANVWQGAANIASRSNEALGGTLDFLTQDPEYKQRYRISTSFGEDDARKYYIRYDTGEFVEDTRAWVSYSRSENTDWINHSAENEWEHIAGKIVRELGKLNLTGYLSWDDTHEDNYQRVTMTEFEENPDWDRLTSDWTGLPYVDQLYRKGWSTIRENLFTYLRAESEIGDVEFSITGYYHYNDGRGDWVPPFITDVTDDGAGGNSELSATPMAVRSPDSLGIIQFVDANGVALAPIDGCVSSITFPYGGAGPEYDPACHASGAIPVGSYRHTHYHKERFGLTGDIEWDTDIGEFDNTLRAGIWYEDYLREESRDWHKVIDSETGFEFIDEPYWTQFDREFPVDTFVYYLQDSVDLGPVIATFGTRQFLVDLDRVDIFNGDTASVNSDSNILISGGLVAQTPIQGLQLFGGYAENFAAIKDTVLEQGGSSLNQIEPETSENIDIGMRYFGERLDWAITYYNIDFENSISIISPDSPAGIDFLLSATTFLNAGGIESDGFEFFTNYRVTDFLKLYMSYTHNDSTYLGSGDALIDTSIGITPGNTVFGSAEDMFVISGNWAISKYIDAGVSTKFVGDRWMDPENTERIDDYIVTDVYLGINGGAVNESLESIDLRLTVNNISDERYIGGVAGGWGGWIGGARAAALSITADF